MNTPPLTGELNELESAICSVGHLAEAEQRAVTACQRRDIRLSLIESLKAVQFLANDIRRKLPALTTEIHHAH